MAQDASVCQLGELEDTPFCRQCTTPSLITQHRNALVALGDIRI
jgi:hypothetical protein